MYKVEIRIPEKYKGEIRFNNFFEAVKWINERRKDTFKLTYINRDEKSEETIWEVEE